MPDRRRHRGAHAQDRQDFDASQLPGLRSATADLAWLLGRRYAEPSALKLVGDRYQLRARQRTAVARCACSGAQAALRASRRVPLRHVAGRRLSVDGFNCLITLEAAMAGAPLLVGLDGAYRDMASVHGTYRRVEETEPAVEALCLLLREAAPASVRWLLDRPVSNSGALRGLIEQAAARCGLAATVELHGDVDRALLDGADVVASSDSWVIDHAPAWVDLPRAWCERHQHALWLCDLRDAPEPA